MKTFVTACMALLMLASASQAALVADWKIDEGSGLTFADSSGNGHTATAGWASRGWSNDGSRVPVNASLGAPSDGKCIGLQTGESITLASGTNAQINSTFSGPFTVFVRAATEYGASWALTKGNVSLRTVAEWSYANWFGVSVNGSHVMDGKVAVANGTPVDLALTWDSSLLSLYVNGELKNTWGGSGVSFDNTSPLLIVREARAGGNAAWVESARLYSTALSASEVLALSTVVPEPMTLALLAMGGVMAIRRR